MHNLQVYIILSFTALKTNGIQIIRDLIQFNVAGHPVLHKTVEYPFDPNVGERRSRQYQEINGIHGERYVERLGLGKDGKDLERLEEQKIRDQMLYQLIRS